MSGKRKQVTLTYAAHVRGRKKYFCNYFGDLERLE